MTAPILLVRMAASALNVLKTLVIAYADLTADTCIGWAQDKLGGAEKVTEIEQALEAQIDEKRNPNQRHWERLGKAC